MSEDPTHNSELLAAAEDYMSRGLAVIALTGKMPNGVIHRHGLHDALTSESNKLDVRLAFTHPNTTGVGILTTWPLIVVDIDGPEGADAWLEIAGEDDYIPGRWVAKTGRGLHLYMALPANQTNTFKLAEKLDLKGNGGYVAAPPSLHPDGGDYKWLLAPGDDPLMEAPEALQRLIRLRNIEQQRTMTSRIQRKRVVHDQFDDGKWWATWGFDGVIEVVRQAKEGNRNAALYWAAMTLAEDGARDEDYEDLRSAALAAGLTSMETRMTMKSARQAAR